MVAFNEFNSFSISANDFASAPKEVTQVATQKTAVAKPPIQVFHNALFISFSSQKINKYQNPNNKLKILKK
jgi:hypothetical protein